MKHKTAKKFMVLQKKKKTRKKEGEKRAAPALKKGVPLPHRSC
jgi:hypothetical protein